MMTQTLTTSQETHTVALVPSDATSNRLSRLQEFASWLQATGRAWYSPNLAEYQQYLLTRDETRQVGMYKTDSGKHRAGDPMLKHYGPVSPTSIVTYMATVRGRYKELLNDNATRDTLYTLAGLELAKIGQEDTPANRKAYVDEMLTRLENDIKPKNGDVKAVRKQDRTDKEVGIRLTRAQADALLASPGLIPINKLRDTAILAVFLCTGLREQELADLEVGDLRATADSVLCVEVKEGKGKKKRCVPWGAGQWALAYVDAWLERAGIKDGPVFRGFYKPRTDGSRKMRPGKLTTRAVQGIVGTYRVMIDGNMTTIHPHDLRRTYARRCYDAGMDILAIRDNLGHSDHKTTLKYIGIQDMDTREPPALYTPPHWDRLDQLETQGEIAHDDDN